MSEHDRVYGTGSQKRAVDRDRKSGNRESVDDTREFLSKVGVDNVELGSGIEENVDDLEK
jgi:hypothetical protein